MKHNELWHRCSRSCLHLSKGSRQSDHQDTIRSILLSRQENRAFGRLGSMDGLASMCSDAEPDVVTSRSKSGRRKAAPAGFTQETDGQGTLSDCDSDESMSSCGSSASYRSLPSTFAFPAPTYCPSSDEGTSEQVRASSFVSPLPLQSQGFQDGMLQELMAMGVPTTDNLEEALRSEGRLAYMPPKGERPSPSTASVTVAASPFAQSSIKVPSL